MLTEDMRRVVAEQKLAFVATVCADGTPNLSPKGTIAVWDESHLVFVDIHSPGTVANLRLKHGIEINVVDPFVRKGYRFKGTGEVLTSGELFDRILSFYRERWAGRAKPEPRVQAFVLVKVEQASALVSPAYDDGTEEAEIRATWVAYYKALHGARRGENVQSTARK